MVSSVTDEARVVSAGKQCVRMVRPQQPGAVFNQLGQQMRGPGRITAATQETGVVPSSIHTAWMIHSKYS
jgi:hypothetical protein